MRLSNFIIFVAAACSFSMQASSAEYRDVYAIYAPLANLQAFQYLHAAVKVTSSNAQTHLTDIRFVIHASQKNITTPVMADGTMAFPLSDALYQENPQVEINQPKGTISLSLGMEAYCQPRKQFNYSLYSAMAGEYLTWQKQRISLLARMHMPSPKALLIRFPEGVHGIATILLPNGELHLGMNSRREIRIVENDDWKQSNPIISLDTMPEKIQVSME